MVKSSIVLFQGEEIPIDNDASEIQLFDALGRNVIQVGTIDTKTITPGVYFFRELINKIVIMQKILILSSR